MRQANDSRPPKRDQAILERMRMTFDLYEMAEQMMRQKIRRQNPQASEEEIEREIREWLARRPGAEHGDTVGHPSQRFESG